MKKLQLSLLSAISALCMDVSVATNLSELKPPVLNQILSFNDFNEQLEARGLNKRIRGKLNQHPFFLADRNLKVTLKTDKNIKSFLEMLKNSASNKEAAINDKTKITIVGDAEILNHFFTEKDSQILEKSQLSLEVYIGENELQEKLHNEYNYQYMEIGNTEKYSTLLQLKNLKSLKLAFTKEAHKKIHSNLQIFFTNNLIPIVAKASNLVSLDLSDNYIGNTINDLRDLKKLEYLNLSGRNSLSKDNIKFLADAENFASVTTLDLSQQIDYGDGLSGFGQSLYDQDLFLDLSLSSVLSQLTVLNLSHANLNDGTIKNISNNKNFGNLKELRLSETQLTPQALIEIVNSPYFKLEALDVSGNKVGDEAISEFPKSTVVRDLVRLNLNQTDISAQALESLGKSNLTQLKILAIGNNFFGAKELLQAMKGKIFQGLQALDIYQTMQLNEENFIMFTEVFGDENFSKNLVFLNIGSNYIYTDEAQGNVFSQLLKMKSLTTIGNEYNNYGHEKFQKIIRKVLSDQKITHTRQVNIYDHINRDYHGRCVVYPNKDGMNIKTEELKNKNSDELANIFNRLWSSHTSVIK